MQRISVNSHLGPDAIQAKDSGSDCRHVYIVDDDEAVRHSMSFFLLTAGFTCRVFSAGREFLDEAAALPPGCVLLDIRMPDLDGLQVVDMLGVHGAKLPVIIMTGHGDVQTAVAAMKLGVSDFLEKPFEEGTLLEILNRTLSKLGEQSRQFDEKVNARQFIERLTPRETEVLRGLIGGLSNKVIAFKLGVSIRTVEMHRANMMDRLEAPSLSDALRIAFAAGISGL